jgi:hypothetical protein
MIWVAMIVRVTRSQVGAAGAWAMTGAAFAVFGIIHVPEAGFEERPYLGPVRQT